MTRRTSARIVPVLALAASLAPASALAAGHTRAYAHARAKLFQGPAITMQWGQVQVSVKVRGKRIRSVTATAPTDRARSAFINGQAIPLLKTEVLQAQSARISAISGATMTSKAYVQSLQVALRKAGL